jgi:hypothetical protein
MPPGGRWRTERRTGTATQLHEPWPQEEHRAEHVVAICDVVGVPTLVLGSAQPDPGIDPGIGAATFDVARRASGGGAVLVSPGQQVWIDVWLPRADALWVDDVVRSSEWLGSAWRRALCDLGSRGEDLDVQRGRLTRTRWSDLICFAGLGPGEVSWRNKKLVGLSQRRTRAGARFQTLSPLDPVRVSGLHIPARDVGQGLESEDADEIDTFLATQTTCLAEVVAADWAGRAKTVDRAEILEQIAQSVVSAVSDLSAD